MPTVAVVAATSATGSIDIHLLLLFSCAFVSSALYDSVFANVLFFQLVCYRFIILSKFCASQVFYKKVVAALVKIHL